MHMTINKARENEIINGGFNFFNGADHPVFNRNCGRIDPLLMNIYEVTANGKRVHGVIAFSMQ
jgi:hypothetical protein